MRVANPTYHNYSSWSRKEYYFQIAKSIEKYLYEFFFFSHSLGRRFFFLLTSTASTAKQRQTKAIRCRIRCTNKIHIRQHVYCVRLSIAVDLLNIFVEIVNGRFCSVLLSLHLIFDPNRFVVAKHDYFVSRLWWMETSGRPPDRIRSRHTHRISHKNVCHRRNSKA